MRSWPPRSTRRHFLSALLALSTFAGGGWAAQAKKKIAVLDFELLDLTYTPDVAGERKRVASLKPLLEDELRRMNWPIAPVTIDAQQREERGFGYLFEHADVAASLARPAGADWLVVGRLHKASFLFVYLKAHVVDVEKGEQIADLSVEIKGPQERMTRHGVEALAGQITEVIGLHATGHGSE
jgi:hypothetical protein